MSDTATATLQAATAVAGRPDFRALFSPRSVAVVGASEEGNRFGGSALANIIAHGFAGRVFPVNRGRAEVMGLPAFPSISAIGEKVDTAVIAIAADGVINVLRECHAAGVRSAIVVSSGFSEGAAGPQGAKRTEELRAFLQQSGMTILGPSTTGLFNLFDRYFPRAAANQLSPKLTRPGPLALVSQSGAINNIVYNRAQQRGVGVGIGAATGVQMMINVWDVCAQFLEDDRVRQVALVVEQFGDGERCRAVAHQARNAGKSLILLKLGRTERGAAAVQTHSGSLAGAWSVQRSVLRDLGIIIAEDLDQLWEVAAMLEHWGPPRASRTGGLGVLAFSGGEGALLADTADDLGLSLPPPSAQFAETVARTLPLADCTNPFDPTGDVIGRDDRFVSTVTSWLKENSFDAYLIAAAVQGDHLRNAMQGVSQAVGELAAPVMVSFWPVRGLSEGVEDVLRSFNGPVFENSVRALKAYARYLTGAPRPVRSERTTAGVAPLTISPAAKYWEVRAALAANGPVPFAPARRVRTAAEAVAAANELGYPVVLKADVPSTTHKSAAGLVRIGLGDSGAVRAAVEAMSGRLVAAGTSDFVVEAQISGEIQVFIGAKRDPEFGPVLVFGSGGVAVEFLQDVSTIAARDLWRDGALELLHGTRIGRFLAERCDQITKELIAVLTHLAASFSASGLDSVDLNPIIIRLNPPAITIVDARVG